MKKYIKMLPVMLYPYTYLLCLIIYGFAISQNENLGSAGISVLRIVAIIYNLYSFIIVIMNAVQTGIGKYTGYEAAKMNLLIKGVQIPAYIFHFLLGMAGSLMSVWGIGFILWAIFIDVLTITLTGINAIGCSIRMYKEGIYSKGKSVLLGVLNFVFCIDFVVAVIYFVKTKWAKKNAYSRYMD